MKKLYKIMLFAILTGVYTSSFADNISPILKTENSTGKLLSAMLVPQLSEGYAAWKGFENQNVKYLIEVLSKRTVLKTFQTEQNFFKFDLKSNLMRKEALRYKVKAIDLDTNEIIGVSGEDIIWSALPDHIGKKVLCNKICNGPDYAWELELLADDLPNVNVGKLMLSSAIHSYDPVDDKITPFYEAMSVDRFTNNSTYYNDNNHASHFVELPLVIQASDPHIYDAFGTLMTGKTYFVEKKMRTFAYANGNNATNDLDNSTCMDDLTSYGGWISDFNNYPASNNSLPDGNFPNLMGEIDASELSCVNSPYQNTHSGNAITNVEPINASVTNFYLCSWSVALGDNGTILGDDDSVMTVSNIPCDEIQPGNGTVGGYALTHSATVSTTQRLEAIDHIELDSISWASQPVLSLGPIRKGSVTSVKLDDDASLMHGLYRVTIVEKDGVGRPYFVEIKPTKVDAEEWTSSRL